MNLIQHASELATQSLPVSAAIGVFDGVHLGHQQVINRTLADARASSGVAVVITFDCHPNSVVAPERNPPLIYSVSKKLRILASLGVDTTLLLHFDRAFSQQNGEAFIRGLARDFGRLHSLAVGADFTFGYRRSGNLALINQLSQDLGFKVHGVEPVLHSGYIISSTRIREAIRTGNFAAVDQMLGRPYSLGGRVVRGDQVGRQLGFPTANLAAPELVLPPNGVYAAWAILRDAFPTPLRPIAEESGPERGQSPPLDGAVSSVALAQGQGAGETGGSDDPRSDSQGRPRPAVVNIGRRPTLDNPLPHLQVEAHLLDFSGDLYGAELELIPARKLRDEQKFATRDLLRAQIARDVAEAKALLEISNTLTREFVP